MVEAPRLSSLAGELLKFFAISSVLFGVVLSFVFFFIGGIEVYYSVGAGLAIALAWVLFNIIWMKGKLEELFGRLLYVVDLLEEKHKEPTVVPIPIHEEVLSVVNSIKNVLNTLEERYQKELRDLEEQMDLISENSSKIIEAIEKIHEGRIKVDFPSGLDPVGAIGQALQQTFDLYAKKLARVKDKVAELRRKVITLSLLLEEGGDKIDMGEVKRLVNEISDIEVEIEGELKFIRDV